MNDIDGRDPPRLTGNELDLPLKTTAASICGKWKHLSQWLFTGVTGVLRR
jgi:hypothetical protein